MPLCIRVRPRLPATTRSSDTRARLPALASRPHVRGGEIVAILKWVGVLVIGSWLMLWLVLDITFATVHALLLIGLAAFAAGFIPDKPDRKRLER